MSFLHLQEVHLGYVLGLGAAFFWASSVLLFRKNESTLSPQLLCLFRNFLTAILMVITCALIPGGYSEIFNLETRDLILLALSGVIGVTLADTFFFLSIKNIEMSVYGIIQCLYSPSVIVLAMLFLDERLSLLQFVGVMLVVSASLLLALNNFKKLGNLSPLGFFAALATVFCNALAAVIAKPVLMHTSLIPALTFRVCVGTLLLLLELVRLTRNDTLSQYTLGFKGLPKLIPATLLGSYFSTLCWLGGFKFAPASIVSTLNEFSSFFIVILGIIFFKEQLNRYKVTAITFAVLGLILVLRLFD